MHACRRSGVCRRTPSGQGQQLHIIRRLIDLADEKNWLRFAKQNAAPTAAESMYGRVPEMYELPGGAPFRRDDKGRVFDSVGTPIKLLGATAEILHELATDPAWSDTKVGAADSLQPASRLQGVLLHSRTSSFADLQVAYVSRTEYPEYAIPCLQLIQVADGISMYDLAQHHEIYPGSKRTHFQRIHKASGIGKGFQSAVCAPRCAPCFIIIQASVAALCP